MRSFMITFALLIVVTLTQPLHAQNQDKIQKFSIETEPVAYILGGAGITGSYQYGPWTYSIEAYGELTIPESMHGNAGFTTGLKGIILQAERFITGTDGFYIGPEFGIASAEVSLKSTSESKTYTGYSIGLRGGYHWNTGLGNLYLSPVVGLGYTLNNKDIEIAGQTFESGPFMPWGTVGIGWSF